MYDIIEQPIDYYVKDLDDIFNTDTRQFFKNFEKKLKKCFRLYEEHSGYEDYKMNNMDIIILHTITKYSNKKYTLIEYLVIMYSYYKLEEFYFPMDIFNVNMNIFSIILNNEIIKIINLFLY